MSAPLPAAPSSPLAPESPIRCAPLHAVVPARVCVLRQLAAARGRTTQRSRGQGTLFPTCDGCALGAEIRAAVGSAFLSWRGAGPRALFIRQRRNVSAARRRLRRLGLLDPPPTIDEPPEGINSP